MGRGSPGTSLEVTSRGNHRVFRAEIPMNEPVVIAVNLEPWRLTSGARLLRKKRLRLAVGEDRKACRARIRKVLTEFFVGQCRATDEAERANDSIERNL